MHDGSLHHAGNGTHSFQQIVRVHYCHYSKARSEGRGAAISAGLRVAHFPGRPPRSTGSGQDQYVIAVRLDPEHLMTPGHRLPSREPEHLAAGSPDLDLLAVIVPKSRHYPLHRDYL